jgi:molecular chaperone GrpE
MILSPWPYNVHLLTMNTRAFDAIIAELRAPLGHALSCRDWALSFFGWGLPDQMNVHGPDHGPDQEPDQEEEPADSADETRTALNDLTERVHDVAEQLAEFHRRSAHRELVIDRLHEENQQLRAGLSKAILEPVVADLIRLYDQVDREARRLKADGQDERLLESFADDVVQILDRCGIDIYMAKPGDPFDRDRHRPLAVVDCPEESRNNTVAEVTAAGFVERETGRVRRPLQARFYQHTPAPEPEPSGDGT